jgi:hypothetical protein
MEYGSSSHCTLMYSRLLRSATQHQSPVPSLVDAANGDTDASTQSESQGFIRKLYNTTFAAALGPASAASAASAVCRAAASSRSCSTSSHSATSSPFRTASSRPCSPIPQAGFSRITGWHPRGLCPRQQEARIRSADPASALRSFSSWLEPGFARLYSMLNVREGASPSPGSKSLPS